MHGAQRLRGRVLDGADPEAGRTPPGTGVSLSLCVKTSRGRVVGPHSPVPQAERRCSWPPGLLSPEFLQSLHLKPQDPQEPPGGQDPTSRRDPGFYLPTGHQSHPWGHVYNDEPTTDTGPGQLRTEPRPARRHTIRKERWLPPHRGPLPGPAREQSTARPSGFEKHQSERPTGKAPCAHAQE